MASRIPMNVSLPRTGRRGPSICYTVRTNGPAQVHCHARAHLAAMREKPLLARQKSRYRKHEFQFQRGSDEEPDGIASRLRQAAAVGGAAAPVAGAGAAAPGGVARSVAPHRSPPRSRPIRYVALRQVELASLTELIRRRDTRAGLYCHGPQDRGRRRRCHRPGQPGARRQGFDDRPSSRTERGCGVRLDCPDIGCGDMTWQPLPSPPEPRMRLPRPQDSDRSRRMSSIGRSSAATSASASCCRPRMMRAMYSRVRLPRSRAAS